MKFAKHIVSLFLIAAARLFLLLIPHFERAAGVVQLRKISNRGSNCHFEGSGILIHPERITLGNDTYVGRNFFIRASGSVSIGSYTHISRNVTIHTVNHNINADMLPYDRTDIEKSVKIGNFVWIGMNACILPGVTIGDGAIIGMNTTVSKDVPPGSVVVSSPQRIVGNRDEEKTASLIAQDKYLRIKNWWTRYV